jgi:hypothetical protein
MTMRVLGFLQHVWGVRMILSCLRKHLPFRYLDMEEYPLNWWCSLAQVDFAPGFDYNLLTVPFIIIGKVKLR